jgi:hypothetical protein
MRGDFGWFAWHEESFPVGQLTAKSMDLAVIPVVAAQVGR